MSRQQIASRNNFFRSNMQRAEMLRKRKQTLEQAKYGEVIKDPKQVDDTEVVAESVVPDLEVSEE